MLCEASQHRSTDVAQLTSGLSCKFHFFECFTLTSVQSSAFIVFPDVYSACAAASVLRDKTAVDAVEMFDRASLK